MAIGPDAYGMNSGPRVGKRVCICGSGRYGYVVGKTSDDGVYTVRMQDSHNSSPYIVQFREHEIYED